MDNAGVLNFNRAEVSEDSRCSAESEADADGASTSGTPRPVRARLGRFLDLYSPEHLNLTPKPKNKLLFNQIRNEGPITITPEKCYESDNEYKCRSAAVARERRGRLRDHCSFEGNQSFPRVRPRALCASGLADMDLDHGHGQRDLVRVDGPNGLRFNSVLSVSGAGAGEVGGASPAPPPLAALQPHLYPGKAVFTIEPHSSKILIVNSAACSLLGYSAGELSGVRFAELVRGGGGALAERGGGGGGAPGVLLAGKVVELRRKEGGAVQASLWVRQLEAEGPRLVVAEPVSARTLLLTVDADSGRVLAAAPDDAAPVFGADCADRLLGLPIAHLIPSIRLPAASAGDLAAPDTLSKQKATGRTLDGGVFPLCLWVTRSATPAPAPAPAPASTPRLGKTKDNLKEKRLLDVNVRVTYNVSGLLVVDEGGVVSACNHHFAQLTFGKHHHEVVGRRIDTLIRNFCRDTDLLRLDLDLDPDRDPDPDLDLATRDNTDMTLSPLENRTRDRESASASASESEESGGLFEGSQRSACTSHVQPSASAAATPTQDMVSSLADTSSRPLPDLVSHLSVSDATLPPAPALSKSRSESVLRRDRDRAARAPDPDPDPPGSDETSADFLTPINEMPPPVSSAPPPPPDLDLDPDLGDSLGTESAAGRHPLGAAGATSTPARGGGGGCAGGGGTYRGTAVHKDGTELPVVYTVSSLQLASGARVRCVWLGVALDTPPRHASTATATPDSSLVLAEAAGAGAGAAGAAGGGGGTRSSRASSRASRPHSMSLASQQDRDEQLAGDYSKHYVTLKQIGKGAFGCVKMAYRRSDRLLAVTKFILKEKVGAQFWVDAPDAHGDARARKLPLELSLLLTLDHPNIVSVIDWFENDKYFQMVMEKHGAGMDLFEFIERRPRLDEPLLAYIYRQICEAVAYLHSLNILHRDIKDENVIIDDRFHVKLIDFGSAAFRATDGGTFGTFYGTTEYCSPEVLAGNRYAGPELEVWAMGVTLYVLAFAAAPFADMEDTLRGALALPALAAPPPGRRASPALEALLRAALARDPAARITVPQLVRHPWVTQPVALDRYCFADVVECTASEAAPDTHFRPRRARDRDDSSADVLDLSSRPEGGEAEGEVTSLSEDATGHAAADIDIDLDRDHLDPDPDLDSWDECEGDQDSFS